VADRRAGAPALPAPHRELELRPLAADSTRALVRELAEGDVPRAGRRRFISERSGGTRSSPAEALRDVVERGSIVARRVGWQLAVDPDMLEVPPLVQGVLQARLDRLSSPAPAR
jgi:hypothetical protein